MDPAGAEKERVFLLPATEQDFVRIAKGLAFLEAVISPEWENRYYSFYSKWSDKKQMASMRNGQGDAWFALVLEDGIAITGHLSGIDGDKTIFSNLPEPFWTSLRDEPAFSTDRSCFCFYWTMSQGTWTLDFSNNTVRNRVSKYFEPISEGAEGCNKFFRWYYEKAVDQLVIEKVMRNELFAFDEIKAINGSISEEQLNSDIGEIGYASGY